MNPQIEEPGIPTDTNSDIQEFYIVIRDCDQQNYTDLWIGRSQNPGVSRCRNLEINRFRDESWSTDSRHLVILYLHRRRDRYEDLQIRDLGYGDPEIYLIPRFLNPWINWTLVVWFWTPGSVNIDSFRCLGIQICRKICRSRSMRLWSCWSQHL